MNFFNKDIHSMCDFGYWANAAALSRAKPSLEIPTAGVCAKNDLYINQEFWSTLEWQQKIELIQHERIHIVLKHHKRAKKLAQKLEQYLESSVMMAYNYIADAHINKHLKSLHDFGVTWEKIIQQYPEMSSYIDKNVDDGTQYFLSLNPQNFDDGDMIVAVADDAADDAADDGDLSDLPDEIKKDLFKSFGGGEGCDLLSKLKLPIQQGEYISSPESEHAIRRLQGTAWLKQQSPSWGRPNRRNISGLRGKSTAYNSPEIHLYVDVSGSMTEYIPAAIAWAKRQAEKGGGSVKLYAWSDTVPDHPTLNTESGGTNWPELKKALNAPKARNLKRVVLTDLCGANYDDIENADLLLVPPGKNGVTWEGFKNE